MMHRWLDWHTTWLLLGSFSSCLHGRMVIEDSCGGSMPLHRSMTGCSSDSFQVRLFCPVQPRVFRLLCTAARMLPAHWGSGQRNGRPTRKPALASLSVLTRFLPVRGQSGCACRCERRSTRYQKPSAGDRTSGSPAPLLTSWQPAPSPCRQAVGVEPASQCPNSVLF